MYDGIFIPKDLNKYKEEAIEHLFKDIDYIKNQLEGFLKAFNSLKNITFNKNDFPMIKNKNELLFLKNKVIPLGLSKGNRVSTLINRSSLLSFDSKVIYEDKFFYYAFQILLGDNIEYFYKKSENDNFSDLNLLNNDVMKKIKENNSNILGSIFMNIEN